MVERDYVVVQSGPKQTAAGGWQEASLGEVIELNPNPPKEGVGSVS